MSINKIMEDSKKIQKFIKTLKIDETDEKKIERMMNLYKRYKTYLEKSKLMINFEDFIKLDAMDNNN